MIEPPADRAITRRQRPNHAARPHRPVASLGFRKTRCRTIARPSCIPPGIARLGGCRICQFHAATAPRETTTARAYARAVVVSRGAVAAWNWQIRQPPSLAIPGGMQLGRAMVRQRVFRKPRDATGRCGLAAWLGRCLRVMARSAGGSITLAMRAVPAARSSRDSDQGYAWSVARVCGPKTMRFPGGHASQATSKRPGEKSEQDGPRIRTC